MDTTKEQMAARLHGREYRKEITKEETAEAKASGLIVIFGASDDLCELYGAIRDEVGCCDGGEFYITPTKVCDIPDEDEEEVLRKYGVLEHVQSKGHKIEARWNEEEDGPSWFYVTEIPHAEFEITDDGMPYCRGIVIDVADLP